MLPENVGTGTVTGTFLHPNGDACQGEVRFQPVPARLLNPDEDVIIVRVPPTVVPLDGDGSFSVELIATDDVDLDPVDWTYQVDVAVTGAQRWTFHIAVPEGSDQDLADIAPVSPSPGTPGTGVVSVNGQTGIVVLDAGHVGADVAGSAAAAEAAAVAAANAYTDAEIAGVEAGSTDWGDIGGTLAAQTDLAAALGAKADASALATVATTGAYVDLDGTPTLGTAAAEDVEAFMPAGSIVEIDDVGNWPPADDPGVLYVLTDDGE